jgi:FMN phosphatase YigB (HAD superfamily)
VIKDAYNTNRYPYSPDETEKLSRQVCVNKSRLIIWLDYFIIQISGYFDRAYYVRSYPEFNITDKDPLVHFLKKGWKENKNPSIKFNTAFYLSMNLDVDQVGINPLIHFIRSGRSEGRQPLPGITSLDTARYRKTGLRDKARDVFYVVGKWIFRGIPAKPRRKFILWIRTNLGFLFDSTIQNQKSSNNQPGQLTYSTSQHRLIDLSKVDPASDPRGSIAIHIHIFYPELAKEFVRDLKHMPFPYDLYISVSGDAQPATCQALFSGLPACQMVRIEKVENRGRDIAPMFCTFGEELNRHVYIGHLHTKKSAYNQGATEGWRTYLSSSMMGTPDRIKRIFFLMQGRQPFGVVYPQNYALLPYWANTWLANKALGQTWCARLGIDEVPRGYFNYPASSMFWARSDALAPLFKAGIKIEDFPAESGQTDGTLAHCLERMIVLCSIKQSMQPAILADTAYPSWSPWRFDQYIHRTDQDVDKLLDSSKYRLISFDIFDTLLCRPLLDPETIKAIVSRRISGDAGILYKQYRAIAEQQAREHKGADIGLDDIYNYLGKLSGLSKAELTHIRRLEEEVEVVSLEPRPEVVALFKKAIQTGKPVVLISDMFLPQALIEKCLLKYDISGWDAIFLSNSIGLRKDSGDLYTYVLKHFKLTQNQLLMVGDNERSDVQIPCDMGAGFIHTIKPGELARGLPRFADLIAEHERKQDPDAELTLGLGLRKAFSPIKFSAFTPESLLDPSFYQWGFGLVGPLLVSFADWLLQKAQADGMERLFFLSREGKIIKQIFDLWVEGKDDAPVSEYLTLSRRAAGVSAITSFKDIIALAQTTYYPNTLESFLQTRYGLSLDEPRWQRISQAFNLNRDSIVSVYDQKVNQLESLLRDITPEILARVQLEKVPLFHYLQEIGLNQDGRRAVVDIGYGGSVQRYLNILLSTQVHGYYMMTEDRSMDVAKVQDVLIRACYLENIDPTATKPIMYRYRFEMEKLLSSDDPQVEYYQIDPNGHAVGQFRPLTPEESGCSEFREQIRQGVLDYTQDARRVNHTMLKDFHPSCWTAGKLMEAFLSQLSEQERLLLSKIVLDDFYCGRGLVS